MPLVRFCRAPVRLAVLTFACANAFAHVTLETPRAEAGSTYKAVLRVGHGCDGSATRELVVAIPPGVQGAQPMAKPGWRVEAERQKLAVPYSRHGRTVSEDVATIRFSGGPLPDGVYDEFVVVVRLPQQAGELYWQVGQICEKGRIDWADLPQPGQSLHDLKAPAAKLEVTPTANAAHSH